jgi:hypothetical protein
VAVKIDIQSGAVSDNLLMSPRPVKVCYMEDQLRPQTHCYDGLEEELRIFSRYNFKNARYISRPNPTGIGIDADITVTELGFVHIGSVPDSLP